MALELPSSHAMLGFDGGHVTCPSPGLCHNCDRRSSVGFVFPLPHLPSPFSMVGGVSMKRCYMKYPTSPVEPLKN